ncbi:MAG: type III pantothenate kinase [Clostridia bacterium]|nr:type III pantothenate kinase [Clostridia bacterium]
MILAIDIGNTNIVLGGITDGKVDFMARLSTNRIKTEDEYGVQIMNVLKLYNADRRKIEGGIISSVVPPVLTAIKLAVKMVIGKEPLVVGPGVKTGLNILMDNPGAVGSDRIVSAVAALDKFKPPIIIVDMGTATTIDTIDKKGNYVGGCIMPGVGISLQALSSSTAQLPAISFEKPKKAIGKNTIDCMKSGVVFGTAGMIDGCVERIETELGEKCKVIITGGLGKNFAEICKGDYEYIEELLLNGLYIIYNKNK